MSSHDHEEMEKHFDQLLSSVDSVQINFATEFYSVLEKYAEHYAAQQQPESTAILKAAKELGRIEVLDAAISSSLLAYPYGQLAWIDPVSIQLKRGSRSEFLDAHREAVL